VKIPAAVGSTHDHDDELTVGEYLLVAHRRLEQVTVLVDPALEIEGPEFSGGGFAHGSYGIRWGVHDVTVSTNARAVAARRQPPEPFGLPPRDMFVASFLPLFVRQPTASGVAAL
jgi:hypothetical protein